MRDMLAGEKDTFMFPFQIGGCERREDGCGLSEDAGAGSDRWLCTAVVAANSAEQLLTLSLSYSIVIRTTTLGQT